MDEEKKGIERAAEGTEFDQWKPWKTGSWTEAEREREGGFVAIETTNSNEKQTNKRHESNEENPVDFGTEPVLNYNEKKNNKKQKKGTKESLESHPGGSGDRVGKSSR